MACQECHLVFITFFYQFRSEKLTFYLLKNNCQFESQIVIWLVFSVSVSDSDLTCYIFRISQYLHKSSIYLVKSLEILRFHQYFCGFKPYILHSSAFHLSLFYFDFGFIVSIVILAGVFSQLFSFHHCLYFFCPYLKVYSRVLGMCFDFSDQDFVVFPASATT